MRRLLNSISTPIAAHCLSERNDGTAGPFFNQIFGDGDRAAVMQIFGQAGGIG